MNKTEMKEELINRYKYIYENAPYILAPYMTEEMVSKHKREYPKLIKCMKEKNIESLINLKGLSTEQLLDLDSFLLSDIPYKESKFYTELESNKNNQEYLNKVKEGLALLEKDNARKKISFLRTELDSWKIFNAVREFINSQYGNLNSDVKKMAALDEYFRINRYSNDGKVWTSGYNINMKDVCNNDHSFLSMVAPKKIRQYRDNMGIKKSKFIDYICDNSNHNKENNSILTEKEKQDIYLTYHDELPWDLEKSCESEEENYLARPDHTKPCGNTFNIKEDEIFIKKDEEKTRYYELCPYCGYIVNIPEELLSEGIKKRIEERCSKDPNLFRKMYLYSELYSLDKNSTKGQKLLLKK